MNLILLIAGMTAVTYLPRMVPLLGSRRRPMRGWQRRALRLIPLTAVGALLVPEGFTAVDGAWGLSLVGLAAAVALAALVRQPFVVVVGAVAAVVVAQLLGM